MFKQKSGLTLTELLIALALLGVIATFTIPKILSSQQTSQNNAMAKEVIAMVKDAYMLYQLENSTNATVSPSELTPYMNYVGFDTVGGVDAPTGSPSTCGPHGVDPCLVLHNGGYIHYWIDREFGGTEATNAFSVFFDPDGRVSGPEGDTLSIFLYYDGRVRTYGTIDNNTCDVWGCINPVPSYDPPWFSWD